MNDDLLKVLVPAAIGLLGTVLGLWLGHRRWASELGMNKRRAFDFRRHQAYLQLWDIVESAHIKIRGSLPTPAEIAELDRQINAFRMRNDPFIDADDAALSNRYFNGIVRLAEEVADSGSKELAERFSQTGVFGPEEVGELNELANATSNLKELRDQLIGRVRVVLTETSYAVDPSASAAPGV